MGIYIVLGVSVHPLNVSTVYYYTLSSVQTYSVENHYSCIIFLFGLLYIRFTLHTAYNINLVNYYNNCTTLTPCRKCYVEIL